MYDPREDAIQVYLLYLGSMEEGAIKVYTYYVWDPREDAMPC